MSQIDHASATDQLSHTNWDEIPIEQLNPLIGRQFLIGTNVMIARVLLKQGAVVPLHRHHNEQVSYILEGALKFILKTDGGDKEITVNAGEVLCIPPNLPHEAHALEDTIDLDIFNPPRQDWIDRDDAYLRQTR
jgi:quercetin dioxygenase-like cupin family protein